MSRPRRSRSSTTRAPAPSAAAAMTMRRRRRRSCRRRSVRRCACSSCDGTSTAGTTSAGAPGRREGRRRCRRQDRRLRISRLAAHWSLDRDIRAAGVRTRRPSESATGRRGTSIKLTLGSMYDIPNLRLVNHRVPGIKGYLKGVEPAVAAGRRRLPLPPSRRSTSWRTSRRWTRSSGGATCNDARWLAVLDAVAKAARWTPTTAAARSRGRRRDRPRHRPRHPLTSYGAAVAEIEVNKETGVDRREAHVRRASMRASSSIPGRRKPDQRPAGPGREPDAEGRGDILEDQRHEPRLDHLSDPAVCRDAGGHADRRAAAGSERPPGRAKKIMAAAAAAIANAFFDATGVRLREYPLTPSRVKAAPRMNS